MTYKKQSLIQSSIQGVKHGTLFQIIFCDKKWGKKGNKTVRSNEKLLKLPNKKIQHFNSKV